MLRLPFLALLLPVQVIEPVLPYPLKRLLAQHESPHLYRRVNVLVPRAVAVLPATLLLRPLWGPRLPPLYNVLENRASFRTRMVVRVLPVPVPLL